jgi:hypothetical protein
VRLLENPSEIRFAAATGLRLRLRLSSHEISRQSPPAVLAILAPKKAFTAKLAKRIPKGRKTNTSHADL